MAICIRRREFIITLGGAAVAYPICGARSATGDTAREHASGTVNLCVNPSGSDSNDGLSAARPLLNIQTAVDRISKNYDLAGQQAIIKLATGTYDQNVRARPVVGRNFSSASGAGVDGRTNSLLILGDIKTPANINITGGIVARGPEGALALAGIKITNASGAGLTTEYGGIISLNGKMEFGPCSGPHMEAYVGGQIILTNLIGSGYIVSGGSTAHLFAGHGGLIEDTSGNNPATIIGTPNFSEAFAVAQAGIIISIRSTYSGAVTGIRYSATLNGVIQTDGGGANYFPGDAAGTTATGGQYN